MSGADSGQHYAKFADPAEPWEWEKSAVASAAPDSAQAPASTRTFESWPPASWSDLQASSSDALYSNVMDLSNPAITRAFDHGAEAWGFDSDPHGDADAGPAPSQSMATTGIVDGSAPAQAAAMTRGRNGGLGASSRSTWSDVSAASDDSTATVVPKPNTGPEKILLTRWLRKIGVPEAVVEIAAIMGISQPSDFLMFTEQELSVVYDIDPAIVTKIRTIVLSERKDAGHPNTVVARMRKCVALHDYQAVEEAHLSAQADEEFRIMNSSFEWWLCRNSRGQTGLLPSNHLEEIDMSVRPVSAAFQEMPGGGRNDQATWEDTRPMFLRRRIKQMMADALMSDDEHDRFMTYNTVKTTLIREFDEATYKSQVEHVKECIRRAEELMREKHNSIAVASKEMIKAEMKRRHRKSKKKAKHKQMEDTVKAVAPAGGSTGTDDSESSETELASAPLLGRDLSPPSSALKSLIKTAGWCGFGHLPTTPPLPPRNKTQSGRSPASLASGGHMIAEMSAWQGGWFSKKGDAGKSLGISLPSATKDRFFVPSQAGLKYYAKAAGGGRQDEKGEVCIDMDTTIEYPSGRHNTVLITPRTRTRTFDLTAKDDACFKGMQQYLRMRMNAPKIVGPSELEHVKSLDIGHFANTSLTKWKGRQVIRKTISKTVAANLAAEQLHAEICTLFPLGIDYCTTIVGCGLEASKPFLLEEFAMFYSLKKHLNSGLQIDLPQKLELFRAVFRGMSFLHSQFGRPHLRLHCNNIVVTESKMLKITDYGFAHLVQHLGSHDPRRRSMLGIGDYVDSDFTKSLQLDIARNDYICSAPEIWTSSSPGLKADVYSLGMVMIEIFTLKPAHSHLLLKTTVNEYHDLKMRPQIQQNCPRELRQLIESCWAAEPASRPSLGDFPRLAPDIYGPTAMAQVDTR